MPPQGRIIAFWERGKLFTGGIALERAWCGGFADVLCWTAVIISPARDLYLSHDLLDSFAKGATKTTHELPSLTTSLPAVLELFNTPPTHPQSYYLDPSQPQYSPHPQHQDPAFAMQAQHYQYPASSSSSSSPPRLAFAPIYHQNGHAQGGIGGQIGAQYPSSISSNDNHLTPEEAELKR
jgi:hypothetical protein